MRVLAVYSAMDFAGPSACEDLSDLAAIGWLPGVDRRGDPSYLDPIDDAQARPAGESAKGVAIRQHPEAMLRDDPELWSVWDQWHVGVERSLSRDDYARLSNFEIESWNTLRAATLREEKRRADRLREGADG